MASRRDCLRGAGGALLAAAALSASAEAGQDHHEGVYGHGMVWNRGLAGLAGDLLLTFDIAADLQTGKGFGTCSDSVHPETNLHFSVEAAEKHGNTITMRGLVTRASNPANLGQPVKLLAELKGTATTVTIELGGLVFHGSGLLVVIAIIAILIG